MTGSSVSSELRAWHSPWHHAHFCADQSCGAPTGRPLWKHALSSTQSQGLVVALHTHTDNESPRLGDMVGQRPNRSSFPLARKVRISKSGCFPVSHRVLLTQTIKERWAWQSSMGFAPRVLVGPMFPFQTSWCQQLCATQNTSDAWRQGCPTQAHGAC